MLTNSVPKEVLFGCQTLLVLADFIMLKFEQAPGDGGGQGSLMCCSPWGLKQLDMTELN